MIKNFFLFTLLLIAPLGATTAWRGPDFLIIGVQKAGTSSLYNYICRHPQVLRAKTKEVHFFDSHFENGIRWYESQFPIYQLHKNLKTGEASPRYFLNKKVPERVHAFYPKIKLIVTLRNPVTRAFSQYKMGLRANNIEPQSFESALTVRPDYYERGRYLEQLKRWLNYFPKEQILIVVLEHWAKSTDQTMQTIFDFLGLPHFHASTYPKTQVDRNPSITLSDETRNELTAYFKPYNEALQQFITEEMELDLVLPW